MKRILSFSWMCIVTLFINCTAEPITPGLSPLSGEIFINEFMASNRSVVADEAGDYDDWIELYNAGDDIIDLSVMFLTDDFSLPMKWSFPDTVIQAGEHLLIWTDGETNEGLLHTSFKLKADPGEEIGLYTTKGERILIIDTLSFDIQRRDTSYGRIPDGGDEWQFLSIPTPGTKNTTNVSESRGILFINEFMASNSMTIADEAGDYDDWVELYNAGSNAINLGMMYLTDDLSQPKKWAFPDTFIAAKGFLLVWTDNESEEGPLHTSFNLAAALGEQLGLYEKNGNYVLIIDTISFSTQHRDTSYGRIPDGSTNWQFIPNPTPGRINQSINRSVKIPTRR